MKFAKSSLQKLCFFSFFALLIFLLSSECKKGCNFATMKLHIFNPDHETAMAADKIPFTPPHAARELRHDLGYIAALWADDNDLILVEDKETAKEAFRRTHIGSCRPVFIEPEHLSNILGHIQIDAICPWGWNKVLKHQLLRWGLSGNVPLPEDAQLDRWREMSGRAWAAENILSPLVSSSSRLVGEAAVVTTTEGALEELEGQTAWVLKSPWSCSGRGVRYVKSGEADQHLRGWVANVLSRQGYLMREPLYNKVLDLAVEFYAYRGRVEYQGLSLFETKNGAYTGNIIAPEERKVEMLSKYIDMDIVEGVTRDIALLAQDNILPSYTGSFGVDMMVVRDGNNDVALHPCVELNLRRTMGHVALSVPTAFDVFTKVMRICHDKTYRLRITRSEGDMP